MSIESLVKELTGRGIKLTLVDDRDLRVAGYVSDEDLSTIRNLKPDLVAFFRRREVIQPADDVPKLQALGAYLGRSVEAKNWGRGTLWGLSPRGAVLDAGHLLITFDLNDIEPIVGADQDV